MGRSESRRTPQDTAGWPQDTAGRRRTPQDAAGRPPTPQEAAGCCRTDTAGRPQDAAGRPPDTAGWIFHLRGTIWWRGGFN